MKSSTKDQGEGKFHKVKGKIKEIAGKLSMNPDLKSEGKDEILGRQNTGKDRRVRESRGEVERPLPLRGGLF